MSKKSRCNISNLYCTEKIDFTKEPMFFGKGKNTQRFDIMKYPFFDKNNEQQLSFYWIPREIKLKQDKQHFESMEEHEQWIYTKVLQKLIFLDSLQGRGPMLTFAQVTTLPELENCILTWDFFEGSIHSRSYSWNLQNVYNNPDEIFDSTFEIDILMKHAEDISSYYNKLYDYVIKYQYYMGNGEIDEKLSKLIFERFNKKLEKYKDLDIETKKAISKDLVETVFELSNENISKKVIDKEFMKEIKKALLLAFVNVNILEGIRFYSGFASIWAMTEGHGIVPGTSKILKFICRDENVHLSLTQTMIKYLKNSEEEGFSELFKELEPTIIDMYKKAIEQEFEWAEYLYSKGSVIGLNDVLIKDYLKYLCNRRMKAIGLKPLFDGMSKNPLPWVNHWISESSVEGTPQELELDSYKVGGIDKSESFDLSDIKKSIGKL